MDVKRGGGCKLPEIDHKWWTPHTNLLQRDQEVQSCVYVATQYITVIKYFYWKK